MLDYSFIAFIEALIKAVLSHRILPGLDTMMTSILPIIAIGPRSPKKKTTTGAMSSQKPKKLVLRSSPQKELLKEQQSKGA